MRPVVMEEILRDRVVSTPAGCTEWTGARDKDGYGLATAQGKMRRAHRAAWSIANGPIPAGMVIMHTCDNPPCINVEHLKLGTIAENNADRTAKGRDSDRRGSKAAMAKLREEQIPDIRKLLDKGLGMTEVARMYNVSHAAISKIARHKTWLHVA